MEYTVLGIEIGSTTCSALSAAGLASYCAYLEEAIDCSCPTGTNVMISCPIVGDPVAAAEAALTGNSENCATDDGEFSNEFF